MMKLENRSNIRESSVKEISNYFDKFLENVLHMNLVFTQLPRQQPKTILNTPAILYQGICQCMNVFQGICRKFKKCLQFLNTKNTIFISRIRFLFLLLKARVLRILVKIPTLRSFFQIILFYYLGFLSRTFLSTTSTRFTGIQILTIAAGRSPLHIARSRTQTRNFWFPSANC